MLARIFVLATVFAASALGTAMPAPTLVPTTNWIQSTGDPIEACKQRGIDINGPIPSDAVKQSDGSYHFDAGSNAFHWVRAQIASPASSSKKRNDPANIGIGMFAQDLCTGQGSWFDDVIYGNHNYGTTDYFSVGISYRGLRDNEHLDFSKLSGDDFCGQYLYSAGFETPVGCFNSQAINCFELWD